MDRLQVAVLQSTKLVLPDLSSRVEEELTIEIQSSVADVDRRLTAVLGSRVERVGVDKARRRMPAEVSRLEDGRAAGGIPAVVCAWG